MNYDVKQTNMVGNMSQWFIAARSSSGVVVKLLACGARGPGFDSTISEIGHLLLLSRDMAELLFKRRKSSKQPTAKEKRL